MKPEGRPQVRNQARAKRWYTYLVQCADDSLYAGITDDLYRRVEVHNSGRGAKYTRSRRPVLLVWFKRLSNKPLAMSLEARVKRLSREHKWDLVLGKKPEGF